MKRFIWHWTVVLILACALAGGDCTSSSKAPDLTAWYDSMPQADLRSIPGMPDEVSSKLEPGTILSNVPPWYTLKDTTATTSYGLPWGDFPMSEGLAARIVAAEAGDTTDITVLPFLGYLNYYMPSDTGYVWLHMEMDACPDSLWPGPSGCLRYIIIEHDGRGFPFKQHPKTGKVVEALHNGSWWMPSPSPSYLESR